MGHWLAVPVWRLPRLPRFSCMGGCKCVVRVAGDYPCDGVPGSDPRCLAAGGQGPIHWGRFWRSRLVTNLLWQSWTSNISVTSDDRLCSSIHVDITESGVPVFGWWTGLISQRESATARNRHGTSPYAGV